MTEKGEYSLGPTRSSPGAVRPPGWVDISGLRTRPRRTITEGYLMQRMNRTNTIAMNQHYVQKILDNKRTPECNRRAVVDFIHDHPDKFMPLCDKTEDQMANEFARKKNGRFPEFGFLARIGKTYGWRR
jgi:hypothetical protein